MAKSPEPGRHAAAMNAAYDAWPPTALTSKRASAFRPIDLYRAYPDHDLLSILPPALDLTAEDFGFYLGRHPCGDTLFMFLARELLSPEAQKLSLSELHHRAVKASQDCLMVATAIAAKGFEHAEQSDHQ